MYKIGRAGITDAGISLPCDGPYQMVRAILSTPDRRVTHDAVAPAPEPAMSPEYCPNGDHRGYR